MCVESRASLLCYHWHMSATICEDTLVHYYLVPCHEYNTVLLLLLCQGMHRHAPMVLRKQSWLKVWGCSEVAFTWGGRWKLLEMVLLSHWEEVLLANGGERPEILLNSNYITGPPRSKDAPALRQHCWGQDLVGPRRLPGTASNTKEFTFSAKAVKLDACLWNFIEQNKLLTKWLTSNLDLIKKIFVFF